MKDARVMGAGVVAVVALIAAMWASNRFEQQHYIGPVKALAAWEGGVRTDKTVDDWLQDQHPDGEWSMLHESAVARVSFEADGALYEWVATHEEIVIVKTASSQAEALTPDHLPLSRLLENAREVY